MANLIGNNSNGGSNSVVGPANNSNNIMLGMPNDNRVPIVMPNSSAVAAGQSASLRDVFLQPAITGQDGQPSGCPYDLIIDMMRGLDLQDDGILRNQKLKAIEMEFCNVVRTEEMLAACMEYMNNVSLADGDTALKFALLFSSRVFDALAMNETKVRCIMLTILETNYINAEMYRMKDRNLLYNSITMLGEYYHNVRLSNDSPIKILGKSLLNLLLREVSEHDSGVIDVKLAKLLLSQITLNGDIMREKHKEEMTQLLFHIRRNLIEQPALKAAVKALLLMSLDLYYSRFANLGTELEEMYKKYLVQDDEDELEPGSGCTMTAANQQQTYQNHMQQQPMPMTQQMLEQQQSQLHQQAQLQQQAQIQHQQQLQQQQQHQQLQQQQQLQLKEMQQQQQQQIQMQQQQLPGVVDNSVVEQDNSFDGGVLNGSGSNSVGDDSYVVPPMTKKWSEQVCEDSLFENEFENECLNSSSAGGGGDGDIGDGGGYGGGGGDRANNSYANQRDNSLHSSNSNSRRSYNKQRNSPRPLKQHNNSSKDRSTENQHSQSAGEERDETKPLPKWRAPRFNRSDNEHDNHRQHQQQRRYSTSYDDDHQSVRSDNGGSIRLYSVNDRLKHSQEKIDRHSNNAYNSIANSNWDRQSQRDDYSERSYMSNYERGNNNQRRGGGGGRHYNNHHRQSYDKPPRFQKNQQQQHQQHHQQQHQQYKEGGPIKTDTWRRSNANSINSYADENSSYPSNGPESNSRSSSRARTLPRPGKSKFDGGNNGGSSNYQQQHHQRRSSQSPNRYGGSGGGGGQYNHNNRGGGGGNRNRNYNNQRYNSQSSLVSEGSSTLERRHNNNSNNNNRNNRNFNRRSTQSPSEEDWDDTNSVHGQPEESSWDSKDNNNELVRNARNTTKYMNYLSSKK